MEYKTPESVPVEWQVGDVILNRYEVREKFEGGGMGIVYRIYHREWNMELAVKSPRAEFFENDCQKKDFEREAETWVHLGLHAHIVTCYYVRRFGGVPHLFAEYVEGGSLADWIKNGRLYEGDSNTRMLRVLDIAIQIASALTFAHGKGLVHQDVKPANILMAPNGTAKLSDFGLARARSFLNPLGKSRIDIPGATVWVENAGMLTPEYASPEQFRGEPLSSRSDIWSWALVVLEMMQGERGWVDGRFGPDALSAHYGTEVKSDPIALLLDEHLISNATFRPHSLQRAIDTLSLVARSISPKFQIKPLDLFVTTADDLNNKGVSLLELGMQTEAVSAFDKAISLNEKHLESSYNRALFLWRIGKIKENAFWQNVSVGFPLNARESYLMGLWHIEAGDLDHGTALLNSALSFGTLEPGEQFSARSALNSIIKSLFGRTHLKGLIGNATALAFSADHAKAIACGGAWKSDEKRYLYINLKVWELSADKCVSNAKGHSEPILCVMTTSDSQIAITGSSDKTVGIWDLKSGSCSSLLKGHAGAVNSVAITRDDSLILSGSEDGTIRAWEMNSKRMFKVFGEHFGPVKTVAVSTSVGASACDANTKIWSVINGKTLATLPFGSHSLAISNNEKFMLAASTFRLRLIEIGTTDVIQDIEVPGGACSFAALSIDGLWGLSVAKDIRFWDMKSGRCSQVIHVKAIQAGFLSGSRWWYRTKECIQIAEKFLGFSSPYALSRPPKPTRHDLFTP